MRRFLCTHFMAIAASLCSIAFASQANAADHLNAAIQAMPNNTWMVVPNSKLNDQNDVEAQGSDFPGIWQGSNRSANGKFPFSGGILDSKRDRMVIWGAGHNDYYGNELYAFNLQDFTWDRITDPSPPLDRSVDRTIRRDILDDGNPNSRHTYYNLAYIPELDSMFVSPGGATSSGAGGLDRNTWMFDFQANEAADDSSLKVGWVNRGKTNNGVPVIPFSPTASAYDPTSGKVYTVGRAGLFDYDVETNFWRYLDRTRINENGGPSDRGMVIDTKRNKIVVVGGGEVAVYDLDDDNGMIYQKQSWATIGNEFQNTSASGGRGRYRPGVNYDPVADRIVVWHGNAVQALNMDTREWEAMAVAPQTPFSSGTYGRFRYSPTQNAYVAINAGNKDVLIYKLQNIPEPTGVALLLAAIPFMTTWRRRRRS